MPRYYMFITLVIHVKLGASMPSLLANVASNSEVELVDHDEESRRVVLRAPARETAYLQLLVINYADAASFEVKASLKGRLDRSELRKVADAFRDLGSRLLFYMRCSGGGAVLGEVRKRGILLKYCRSAANVDPAAAPPTLCSFDPRREPIAVVVEKAGTCFNEVLGRVTGQA
ncbi:hypothetical protein CF15_03530 [Pyrodictium occultum]|uniref:Uncharacterized protein n=1 Tax=Pyrodictium occultum TaxID=2309 RepID=A0A0V8RUZ1_PYROC|nr:hypothetical protein [Pyrodictium occultum]KSW11883.1 hypothetical protein CF15_03530 [Pyrodictium occultum]